MHELVRGLFGPGVLVATMDPADADASTLLDAEAAEIARAVHKRRCEYAAGRTLARRVLAQLGVDPGFALLRAEGGAPRWPDDIIGTISHTQGLAAVAVTRAGAARGLGLDLETDEPPAPEVAAMVCTPDERRSLQGDDAPRLVKLLFAAKEAVYKAQYPLTRARLGFGDVRVELDVARGAFVASLLRVAGPLPIGTTVPGRLRIADGLLATSVTLS